MKIYNRENIVLLLRELHCANWYRLLSEFDPLNIKNYKFFAKKYGKNHYKYNFSLQTTQSLSMRLMSELN